ncbi:hypothetical protein Tco_0005353 [Tanacetum coccineum]
MFIDSQFTLDYDSQMADKYFAEYTRIEIKQFREMLLQHMTNVKKSVAERTHREVNKKSSRDYTKNEAQTFKETIIQNMNSIEQCIIERASHEQELKMTLKKLSERQLQIQQCKVQEVQSSVTSSGDETSSGIVSDEEIEKKELEAHYGFMAKIQEVLPAESSSTDTPLEQILKPIKKANASLTQELEKCKTNLDETNSALGEATSCRDSCLIALQNKKQTETLEVKAP